MIQIKILIIDDEEDFCILMQHYFTDKGFDVYSALTLTEGLKLLEKLKPEIVFLDNNLPDGVGWSKINDIVTAFPNSRLNLISAYGEKPEFIKNSENIRFWEKPISIQELNNVF